MNVYDTANRLASELKSSQEYLDYKKVKEELNNNPEIKEKMDQFEKARYEVQVDLIQNDLAKRYFEIELKFNVLLADVNKIIAESVQDVLN